MICDAWIDLRFGLLMVGIELQREVHMPEAQVLDAVAANLLLQQDRIPDYRVQAVFPTLFVIISEAAMK